MTGSLRRHSNLQRFLDSITPSVSSKSLPKSCMREMNSLWQPIGQEDVEYFALGDLWDGYSEWSAYGAGVPIIFPGGESVIQYYVPYLSAIQIYTTKALASLRTLGEESESDSWSDDSESEKLSRSWDAASEDSSFDQEASWPSNRLGYLYFQYIECCPPWGRIPLMDKVNELSKSYPGLMSFKSSDLSPASWMSVAWYPIYHIPARKNAKDLSASFLTFHTISSCFQVSDNALMGSEKDMDVCCAASNGRRTNCSSKCAALPPFGLATYKMQGSLWIAPQSLDQEKLATLCSAADSWLKQLRVFHHDFNFFMTHAI
ncbi:hypothetical protein HPP92_013995 [Vanilla planifolia]|uniref:Uncharacterized protein n=1 Tax=Vanilla planifolia TaxID=51239 RepID=A0A835USQ4_VANPL|nr:hypothetical protein HPP92_014424 [Vanilla planifolia]KAG0474309.1 hypothetical protein HPP92_013995 [Vanilla planifolia]